MLEVDPATPLEQHIEELYEGLIWVEFPNAIRLDVDWRPSMTPEGQFYVDLANPKDNIERWSPFATRACKTIEELKAIVHEFVTRTIA